jgi:hypothetical protein
MPATPVVIQAKVTRTTALIGAAVAIAAIDANFKQRPQINIDRVERTDGQDPVVEFEIQVSSEAAFANPKVVAVFCRKGNFNAGQTPQGVDVLATEWHKIVTMLPTGVANGAIRCVLRSITANTSVTYSCFFN